MTGTLNALFAEFKYELLRQWRYKFSFVSSILIYTLLYLAIVFLNQGAGLAEYYGSSQSEDKMLLLIGYTYWQFGTFALGSSAGTISGEAMAGLLETKLMSRVKVAWLLFARLISSLVVCVVAQVAVVVASLLFGFIDIQNLGGYLLSLLLFLPSLLGMFGIGLIFAGLTLIYKTLGQFIVLIQTGLLLVSNISGPQLTISTLLIPYVAGLEIARKFYLGLFLEPGEVALYLLISLFWFVVGYTIFNYLLEKNRKAGYFQAY